MENIKGKIKMIQRIFRQSDKMNFVFHGMLSLSWSGPHLPLSFGENDLMLCAPAIMQ